jgi:hypothetical protein
MPEFSERSKKRLGDCDIRIQRFLNELIKYIDFAVVCAHRSELEQNIAFNSTPPTSKLKWPNSKHNTYPSKAVDIVFCTKAGKQVWPSSKQPDKGRRAELQAAYLAGRAMHLAEWMGSGLRWGGDWSSDQDMTDQTFMDLYHFELVK